jgi:hypothetical protein
LTAGAAAVPMLHDEESSVRTATDGAAVVGVAVRKTNRQRQTRAARRKLGTSWSTTRLVPETIGTGDTFDLFDGDLLSERFNYLCDGDGSADEQRWNDSLHRIFLDILHPENGYHDHRSGGVGAVHGRASVGMGRWSYYFIHHADVSCQTASCNTTPMQEWGGSTEKRRAQTCRFGEEQTARWSRGMGRWGFGCIHHASVENQPSADDVGWAGRLGGGRRDGLARSRQHGGVVGWVDGASAASITRAWRISRRLTTWVGPDGWEEGDVTVWRGADGTVESWDG